MFQCIRTTYTYIHSLHSIYTLHLSQPHRTHQPCQRVPILSTIKELVVSKVVSTWICGLHHKIWWNVQWTQQHRGLKHRWCQGRSGFWGMCVVRVEIQHEKESLLVAIEEKIMIRLFFFKDPMCIWKIFWKALGYLGLGGGNSNIFYFHPDPWEDDPIWRSYFSDGWLNHQLVVHCFVCFAGHACLVGKSNPNSDLRTLDQLKA